MGESLGEFAEDEVVWSAEMGQAMKVAYPNADGNRWFCWFYPAGTGGCWREASDLSPSDSSEAGQ